MLYSPAAPRQVLKMKLSISQRISRCSGPLEIKIWNMEHIKEKELLMTVQGQKVNVKGSTDSGLVKVSVPVTELLLVGSFLCHI